MKRTLSLLCGALATFSAVAQEHHLEWTADQLPTSEFASVDEAVAAGYNTMWSSPKYLGMPKCDLIADSSIVVSLASDYSYMSVGNSQCSGTNYAYKIIMGSSNLQNDGIDPDEFADGIVENNYVRKAADSDQGNAIYDAVLNIHVNSTDDGGSGNYGSVTLKFNRGNNTGTIYVVDKNGGAPFVVLSSVTRSANDYIYEHTARFGVQPNHDYYVMASAKGSVELYGVSYDDCYSDSYEVAVSEDNSTDIWTAAQLPSQIFASVDSAVAAGFVTLWGYPDYLGMPATDLISSDNVTVSIANDYGYINKGNPKYSGYSTYAYKLVMGMNNSVRDNIDTDEFADGLNENSYLRTAATADQKAADGSDITVTDAILKITVPVDSVGGTYGRVILNYNRGGNNSAMFVVDQTKNFHVLQSVTRNPEVDGAVKTHAAIFNVQPGHTYYVMASEKSSVEMYAVGYCAANSEKYNALNAQIAEDDDPVESAVESVKAAAPASAVKYNLAGQVVNDNYKGIVISNGVMYIQK